MFRLNRGLNNYLNIRKLTVNRLESAIKKQTNQQPIVKRCEWANSYKELCIPYHDKEWGVPVHDDRKLFEFLILEMFQAGLSWTTILKKRKNFQCAFNQFKPEKVASFDENKKLSLMKDTSIIRNRRKIDAAVENAKAFLKIQNHYGSFDNYIWKFVKGRQIINAWDSIEKIPAFTSESEEISNDLKKHGFTFMGKTICYAFMQAVGMVNDHETGCFRYKEIIINGTQ